MDAGVDKQAAGAKQSGVELAKRRRIASISPSIRATSFRPISWIWSDVRLVVTKRRRK